MYEGHEKIHETEWGLEHPHDEDILKDEDVSLVEFMYPVLIACQVELS